MDKRGKNRKSDRVTMLAVAGYVLFLVIGFPAAEKEGGFYPALLILAGIAVLFAIVYYHSRVNVLLFLLPFYLSLVFLPISALRLLVILPSSPSNLIAFTLFL